MPVLPTCQRVTVLSHLLHCWASALQKWRLRQEGTVTVTGPMETGVRGSARAQLTGPAGQQSQWLCQCDSGLRFNLKFWYIVSHSASDSVFSSISSLNRDHYGRTTINFSSSSSDNWKVMLYCEIMQQTCHMSPLHSIHNSQYVSNIPIISSVT